MCAIIMVGAALDDDVDDQIRSAESMTIECPPLRRRTVAAESVTIIITITTHRRPMSVTEVVVTDIMAEEPAMDIVIVRIAPTIECSRSAASSNRLPFVGFSVRVLWLIND